MIAVIFDCLGLSNIEVIFFNLLQVATIPDEVFPSLGYNLRLCYEKGIVPIAHHGSWMQCSLASYLHGQKALKVVRWAAAEAWDMALRQRALQRPSIVPGIVASSDICCPASQILRPMLCNEVVVKRSSTKQLEDRRRQEGKERLDNLFYRQMFSI
jgi:hypothetical protein